MISIITPIFNEAENIDELASRLFRAMENKEVGEWEWVVVDDGSTDDGPAQLGRLDPPSRLKVVTLSRNFGQQSALMAGLHVAEGDAIVFLDADLQDPPEIIPDLVTKWKAGARVVVARRNTRGDPPLRKAVIGIFHSVFSRMTDHFMPKDTGNFGLFDREVADVLRSMPEHSLYLPGLRAWAGFNRAEVAYDRDGRKHGKPLGFGRLMAFGWDALLAFSDMPLRLISSLGVLISIVSFTYAGWLLIQRVLQLFGYFKNLEVLGFTTLAVAVFFMGGVQLICLGVIGEYLARVYREVKGRPRYVVAGQHELPASKK